MPADPLAINWEMACVAGIFLIGVIFQMGATWANIMSQRKMLARIEAILERQDTRLDVHEKLLSKIEIEHMHNHPAAWAPQGGII